MNKDLYYEITENGYHIYDRNDPLFHVHQYEPYIPDHSKSYEENAISQIVELTAEPAEPNKFGLTDMQVAEIEQDYRDKLTEEIAGE